MQQIHILNTNQSKLFLSQGKSVPLPESLQVKKNDVPQDKISIQSIKEWAVSNGYISSTDCIAHAI